jgi:hypothetical protein
LGEQRFHADSFRHIIKANEEIFFTSHKVTSFLKSLPSTRVQAQRVKDRLYKQYMKDKA